MQNRPDYYRVIDRALERRESLIEVIHAANETLFGRPSHVGTDQLVKALKHNVDTESFLANPKLAKWLPLLLANDNPSMNLEERVRRTTSWMDDEQRLSSSRWGRYSYAGYLFIVFLLLFAALLIWIVPTFKALFTDFQLVLPPPTKALFGLSDFIRQTPWYVAVGLVLILIGVVGILRGMGWLSLHAQGTFLIGTLVSGNRANLQAMSRFAETLAELIEIGAPLTEAIQIAGNATARPALMVEASGLAQLVASPNRSTDGTWVSRQIAPTVAIALSCGLDGGPNVPLLRQLANIYRTQERVRSGFHPQTIGALAAVVLGVLVGVTIIALFMPLISLLTSLSQ